MLTLADFIDAILTGTFWSPVPTVFAITSHQTGISALDDDDTVPNASALRTIISISGCHKCLSSMWFPLTKSRSGCASDACTDAIAWCIYTASRISCRTPPFLSVEVAFPRPHLHSRELPSKPRFGCRMLPTDNDTVRHTDSRFDWRQIHHALFTHNTEQR